MRWLNTDQLVKWEILLSDNICVRVKCNLNGARGKILQNWGIGT